MNASGIMPQSSLTVIIEKLSLLLTFMLNAVQMPS
jgi:hypothetical protein